jgi:hypothetical protein
MSWTGVVEGFTGEDDMIAKLAERVVSGLCFALVFMCGLALKAVYAAPQADLWERWTAHDAASTESIDHGAWDHFVKAYVSPSPDGINRIDYTGVTESDRRALQAYIAELPAASIGRFSRDEQLAYWINLYNALTVSVVLDHYPVESIRDIDISPGFFSDGPWDKKLIEVEGEALSLNDIEHRILRPIWKDPRIHYAVNCASIGCPNLQTTAFTGGNANTLLGRGARQYVNHPRGAQITDGELIASSIYVWYREDFGGSDEGVIRHLQKFAMPKLRSALATVEDIADDRYDWSLNDARWSKHGAI